jgi:retron-type reverse transcriptase
MCKKSKKQMVILKLDFEKAFDKIKHNAMMEILRHKGFGTKWLKWMDMIMSLGTSSIMLNGVPRKTFHSKMGARQGDPLSPLLFVLAADLLQSILNKAKDVRIIQIPLSTSPNQDFPVIQYADDTILIMEACPRQLFFLKD